MYFTNHAICLIKMERWSEALTSCSKALQLDSTNSKARFRKMLCLAVLSKSQDTPKAKKIMLGEADTLLRGLSAEGLFTEQLEKVAPKLTDLLCIYEAE